MRFTVVVMTWGPKQGTPIHDHGGLWCVECVVEGRIEAERFEPVEETNATLRLTSRGVSQDEVGAAGALLPFQVHRMGNPSLTETAVTVHVYGGELDRCSAFIPCADGYFCRELRRLSYTE